MNGLPPTADMSRLVATRAIQLCFGENEVQIHFDSADRIVVESGVIFRDPASGETQIETYRHAASLLCRVLGDSVQSATRVDDGGLLLRFESGVEVQVLNDNDDFESFQIHLAGQTIVA